MAQASCTHVRAWAEQVALSNTWIAGDDAIYRHIVQCDLCRGALAMLTVVQPEVFPAYTEITCDECQADLAAFVDEEERQPGRGVRTYPAVWGHLLHCAECTEDFLLTRALARATARGTLPPPWRVDAPSLPRISLLQPLGQIELPFSLLSAALPAIRPGRAYRGGAETTHVLLTTTLPDQHTFTISVQPEADDRWTLIVTSSPPLPGQVVLLSAAAERSAAFDTAGSAAIDRLTSAQLLGSADSPTTIRIDRLTATAQDGQPER